MLFLIISSSSFISVVKCEPPPTISNGRHNGGDEDFYTYGSSVTYSCDPDFSMLGKASISCTVENKTIGVWYPSPPTCKIRNGIIQSGFGPICHYEESILFSCKKGYILNGNNLIHCDANNEWHPSPPTCELNFPHAVWDRRDNKLSNQEVFEVGTELKYQCKFGYRPIPDEPLALTCQENLTWAASKGCEYNIIFYLSEVYCSTQGMETIRITSEKRGFPDRSEYTNEDHILYTCDGGYYPVSPDGTSVCQEDGTWKPEMPACKKVKNNCEFPPVIAHGQCKIVSKLFAFEQQAVYECDEGYILIGANRLSCAFSGWSPGAPQCKTRCVKPEIEYGKLSVEKVRYVEPERITIQCESGYSMVGSEIITCSEDRTWYPEAPKCEWEYPEGCEQVVTGRKLLQCLSRPVEVKLALEVYKLSLETGQELQLLELQLEKPKDAS
ncbi:hypothetical protein R6Z07F_011387 [Ovis aries]